MDGRGRARAAAAARHLVAAGLAVASLGAAAQAAPEVEGVRLDSSDYAAARELLVESIVDEGLVVSAVSDFGTMLERTDADLHHGGARYRHAEVFAFCSSRVAAALVREALDKIAYCPLTVAIYQAKGGDERVRLLFRGPSGESSGAETGRELLRRIVGRVAEPLGSGR